MGIVKNTQLVVTGKDPMRYPI
nr:hypothetical protein [Clostridium estertheticum]